MYNAALRVLEILDNNGFVGFIVGGYPRDIYMGKQSTDIDICSNAKPVELKRIFPNFRILNEKYGAVIVNVNGYDFEITTFRKEIKYEHNRIPDEFNYVNTLDEDIVRRDFTVNTICIDKDGNVVDLLDGRKDIDLKVIRCVGDPDKKLSEDALRILRAIRFATTLDFELDDSLKEAIKENGYLLKNLSYFRKKQELDRIFTSGNCRKGIDLIKELGIASYLDLNNIDDLVITDVSIGIWAQIGDINKYQFSNIEKSQIIKIREALKHKIDDFLLYRYGLYIGEIVFNIKGYVRDEVNSRYNNLPIKKRSDITITASDICTILNKRPGSFINKIYCDLEEKIVYNKLINDKDVLTSYIKNNY